MRGKFLEIKTFTEKLEPEWVENIIEIKASIDSYSGIFRNQELNSLYPSNISLY
jgi:hypothetical protein